MTFLCYLQEATPAALLAANDLLIKLEGTSSTQQLTLPAGTGINAAAAGAGSSSLLATASGSTVAAAAVPGLPAVHAVLLEQLDLVPSRGGIEAAGLRFMQLQVRRRGFDIERYGDCCGVLALQ